jgi:hypothetical protein
MSFVRVSTFQRLFGGIVELGNLLLKPSRDSLQAMITI